MRNTFLLIVIAALTPISFAQTASADPDLSGTWVDDSNGAIKITFEEKGDNIRVHEMDGDRVLADYTCNLSGRECDVKEDGHTVKITMYYNGSKLVQINERGSDIEKRRFSLAQDGKTMQMEIIPLSSDGKTTTHTYQKQHDSQTAKSSA